MAETIKTYQGSSIGVSQCLVTLESFVGDVENAELSDDSTFDASDAVTAINALIWEMEKRETEIERQRAAIQFWFMARFPEVHANPHDMQGRCNEQAALDMAEKTLCQIARANASSE